MAEYNNLIQQDTHNESYAVLFQNLYRHDPEEIKEIFSMFGKVINVKVTGDETGYRFVRFASYEDAQNAVDNLRNDPTIRLLPHRKKNKNNEEKSNTGFKSNNNTHQRTNHGSGCKINVEVSEEKYNTGFKSNNNTHRRTNHGSGCKINVEDSEEKCNTGFKSNNTHRRTNYGSGCKINVEDYEEKSNTGFKSNNNTHQRTNHGSGCKINVEDYNTSSRSNNNMNHRTDDEIDFKAKHNEFNQENHNKNNSEIITVDKLFGQTSRFNENKSPQYSVTSSCDNLKSVCSGEQNIINEDEIPDLVSFKREIPTKKNALRKIIVDAQAVVVGNIHPKIGPSYILHLFDQFEPLAITGMQTIPRTDIRFCLVYFKTVEESLCVENKFDKLDVLGKKLVVLQENSLVEEARS